MTHPTTPEDVAEYRRLVMSSWDIDEAVGYASALLRAIDAQIEGGAERRQVRQAFSVAFVISYMRPFKQSRADTETARSLKSESIKTLSEPQRRLHARLERLRDQVLAHSDPEPRQLRVEESRELGPIPTMRDVQLEFDMGSAKEIFELAVVVRGWITDRLAAFGANMMVLD